MWQLNVGPREMYIEFSSNGALSVTDIDIRLKKRNKHLDITFERKLETGDDVKMESDLDKFIIPSDVLF